MTIGQHLNELRYRLIMSLVAVTAMMVVAFSFCDDVFFPIIRAPLDAIQGNDATNPFVLKTPLLDSIVKHRREKPQPGPPPNQLYYTSLTVPFTMQFKVAFVIGLILALPVVAYQVWAFVSSGLYPHERRLVLMYGPVSVLLFLLGAAIAYFVVLPVSVVFLIDQGEAFGMKPMLTVDEYMPFVMWILLGFGAVFEMPLIILFIVKIGLVTPDTLAKARRFAVLGIVIVAAVVTPTTDPFTLLAMSIPMVGLYEASILLARIAVRRKKRKSSQTGDQ